MDDIEFKKIDVTAKKNDIVKPGAVVDSPHESTMARRKKAILRSKNFKIGVGVLVVLIIFFGYTAVKAFSIYNAAMSTQKQAKIALAAAKKQNVVLAHEELVKTKKQVESLQREVKGLAYMGFLPLVGSYYNDLRHLANAAYYGVNGSIITTESIIPYADVLGLKGQKSFAMGSAEERIKLAVTTLGKVVPKIDEIGSELARAKKEVDLVDEKRYPNFGAFKKIRAQIAEIKTMTDGGVEAVEQGKPLIKMLPNLLGNEGEKKYLILFQNDKELRPTGGFLTFYAIFKVEQGIIKVDTTSDIYELDKSISNPPPAPDILKKYLPKVPNFNIRDSNLSPDFYESMKTFNMLYERSSEKKNIDGIIALDTNVLVNVLNILGEVSVNGVTFNAKTDARCDCPQVVYVLEDYADRPVNYIKENRKGIIGQLLFAIMQKALSSSPKLYWGPLFQAGIKDIQEKHILFSLKDKDAQKGLEALNWAGRIKDFTGDYLHINDSNFGGAKSNMYVKQNVKMEYTVSPEGIIKKTLTIQYKNPRAHSNCSLEAGGLCLNATLRDFLRVYVPKGSILSSSKGSEVKVGVKEDLGKTNFEGFITVKPLGTSKITYTYTLPFKVTPKSNLPLLIQKQPGTGSIPYEITVNGKTVESFELTTDKQMSLKLP